MLALLILVACDGFLELVFVEAKTFELSVVEGGVSSSFGQMELKDFPCSVAG
jgi:hypothetical protein